MFYRGKYKLTIQERKALEAFEQDLLTNQEELGPEFSQVLHDNLDSLYVS